MHAVVEWIGGHVFALAVGYVIVFNMR